MLLIVCILLGALYGDVPNEGWSSDSWSSGGSIGQLDDAESWYHNEKHNMWMPKGVDPEKYAAENGAAPPPPPGGNGGGGNGGCNGGGGASESTPSTPQLMPSAGGPPSRFSASGSNLSRRGSAASSRYVDTLNPNAGGEEEPAPQQGGGGDNGELAQKLEESQKQLAQYRSQQFAHAQELNSLREELRVAPVLGVQAEQRRVAGRRLDGEHG